MNRTLPEVIADILTHNDGIVDHKEDGIMEALTPSDVSNALGIPEFARLRFSYDGTSDESIYASYDSDFFTSVAKLLNGKGKLSIARYESSIPNVKKLSKTISEKIKFNNATFRLEKAEPKNVSYLLCYFKYVALSDERQEGIMPILINEQNLSTSSFKHDITELNEVTEELKDIERCEIGKVFQSAYSACACMAKENLKGFINSLERRLNRDIRRVYEYYETLKDETRKAIKKKALANVPDNLNSLKEGQNYNSNIPSVNSKQALEITDQSLAERDNLIEKQIQDRTTKGNGIDKLFNKLDAIETERKWKVQDLVAKYALNVQIEPVSAIRIETQSILSWINIKRRLFSRLFPVCFNPIIRQIDALPCESCFRPQKPYYICDDKLHIICTNCFMVCNNCKKQYCKVCYDMCPKCRKESVDN
ncbi:MAG: hypothetical protein SCARUB_01915 [Candidatus Scalindua rubra]|uniref:Uncharacterized protein n=1 Tax=Candidatus Scalindua rubra TaxID=1872076 RepID=A0A1E3XBH7_9BACT|nr:MAG: hypothetical protein SCARUB_01915 [Candidatus Scalindua rubra]